MSDANQETVEHLYRCFSAHDGDGMAACYAPQATFSDPVFVGLRGREVGGMWQMLNGQGGDLSLEMSPIEGPLEGPAPGGERYTVRWTARYTFSATKRKVVNHVVSELVVKDGLITEQRDRFDLAAWLAQAMGPFGHLLGWTGLPAFLIRRSARRKLAAYLRRHP